MGRYCLDIFIPQINIGVEIDGPTHYRKKDEKRDDWIKENYKIEEILRFKSNIKKMDFEREFKEWIVRKYGDGTIEKRDN